MGRRPTIVPAKQHTPEVQTAAEGAGRIRTGAAGPATPASRRRWGREAPGHPHRAHMVAAHQARERPDPGLQASGRSLGSPDLARYCPLCSLPAIHGKAGVGHSREKEQVGEEVESCCGRQIRPWRRWIRPRWRRPRRPTAPPRRRRDPSQELHGGQGRRERGRERAWPPPSLPSAGPPASGSGGSRTEEA